MFVFQFARSMCGTFEDAIKTEYISSIALFFYLIINEITTEINRVDIMLMIYLYN